MPSNGTKADVHGMSREVWDKLGRVMPDDLIADLFGRSKDPYQEIMSEMYRIRQQLQDLQLMVEYLTQQRSSVIITGQSVTDQYRNLHGGEK